MSKRKFKAEILVDTDVFTYDDDDLKGMSESEILEMVENDAIQNAGYLVTEVTDD